MTRALDIERPLEWSEAFSVGHAVLDTEHRGLMAAINDFRNARPEENSIECLRVLFGRLVLFAKQHFDHENAALLKIIHGGPDISDAAKTLSQVAIEEHMNAHEVALARLKAIGQNVVGGPTGDYGNIFDTLKVWFIDHAVNHDSHLKSVFQEL